MVPRTRYAKSGTLNIAYQVVGDGPVDLVFNPGWVTHRIRAGLHTGEFELVDGSVRGIAVHIAARVTARAGPDEILVSSTVKELVSGSGIRFSDRGAHTLKGVPGEWRIFEALA